MTTDLTTQTSVESLMKSSTSESEWNANCDKVKAANNGYPSFWYQAVIESGILNSAQSNW